MNKSPDQKPQSSPPETGRQEADSVSQIQKKPATEIGGPKGPEPTRYGDWEKAGRCIDF
ncbi:MAG: DUF1674 domain-containing protein [Gammaproteobacteria bacterium]|nr:DUF1674 domain-containing protein [Gammaproteobacteria bacterium]